MNYQKYKELGNLFKETFQTVVSDKNNLFDFFNQVQMFHKYDIYEQIFIYGQKSNATHIADFDTWKKLGRFVKKGEKSIAVLSQSTGKINIKHYFDFSQTDGKELDFPDYTLEKNDWNLLVSQEIEDLIDEIVDFTEEPDIRRLSIEIGLFLAKNKSIGSEVIDITEQEFTMLQSLPHFFKVMNYANEVNRLISKEILVYKRERMNEHEFKILRERDRTTDTRSRVSQLSTGEIRENSRSQITGRESSRVSNQTSRGRFDEVGTRDQQKSVEQSKRIDRSIGRSQSTDTSSTSEFRGSVEDTNAISGTSNRTRNERDSIDGKSNSDIKDFEEKQSSESFFVEKNPDYEEITPDFTEEELNNILRRGSGVEGGKIRIYHLYQRTLSKKERVSFLKEEYGWSGSTLDIQGSSFSMMDCRPGKGITVIKKINNEDYERVMKWSEVEERIGLLIRQNEYLTEEELKLVQSKKEESVKEALSQMDTEAEELTLFDLEEIETEEKPVVTEGYGTEVAFIPKIEAKKEIIKLIAAHHIDCPWRPSDIQQRDGRIIRQGNENKEIQIFRYVTKGTFDSFLWQIQEQKQTYISQVMSGKAISRSVDELSETVLDASEVKALATGNPLIAEKMELDNEISRLRMLQSAFLNEQESLKRKVEQNYPKKIQEIKQSITQLEKDIELSKQHSSNEFQVQLMNMTYDSRTEATQKLEQLCQAYNRSEEFIEVGAYQGFSIFLKRSEMQYGQLEMKLQSEGGRYTTLIDPQAGIGMVRRIENVVQKLPEQVLEKQEQLKETEEKLEIAKKQLGQPFPQEEELKEKVAEQTRINTEIECSLSKKTDRH